MVDTEDDITELTEEEIERQIKKLRKKKAPGGMGSQIRHGSTVKRITGEEIIKKVWKGKGFPDDWRKAVVTILHKKGDPEEPGNYRGINLHSTTYKICAAVLNERLRSQLEAERILPESQAGFRKDRGTIDNAYILQHVVQRKIRRGKVYAMFVDLKAAFDIVKRDKLWRRLKNCKIEKGLIKRIKEVYEEAV